ncbi:MAG: fibronectin type III domain-containing protein, partial [Pseudomonadota bacterium]
SGGMKCWGYNHDGQLGDNSTTNRMTQVDVAELGSGVSAIAMGWYHSCALTTAGAVKCWGNNKYGQLGDNSTTNRLTPVDVTGQTSGVSAIAAGSRHSCALTATGGVKCWGTNEYGQLGDNSTTNRLTSVDVTGLTSGVSAISAGSSHSCALTTAGGVKCWGNNGSGQLGDNSRTDSLTPVDVAGLTSGVSAIATGYGHSCALTGSGGVKCWGYNSYGQLGDNSTTESMTPVGVTGLSSGVIAIATGFYGSCGLTATGGVKCWGFNYDGELGDNSTTDRLTPVDVIGLANGVSAIDSHSFHSCALTTAGAVKCWGTNSYGQLGIGHATGVRTFPAPVVTLLPAAPTIVIATGGNAQATVTFTAPIDTGGSSITGYTVTSSPAGGVDSNAGNNNLTHVVAGLVKGTTYTFTVTASNAAGTSEASAPSNSITLLTIPGAPTNIVVTPGAGKVSVSFTAPSNSASSAIASYTVACAASGKPTRSASGSSSPIVVTGLQGGVAYSCSMVANNSIGSGATATALPVVPTRSKTLVPMMQLLLLD